MPSFGKGRGSRNSHEMRLFDMPGMVLLISPILRTYTANIDIQRGSIPMYASMFGTLWPVIPPLFGVGQTLDFMMLTGSMSVKVGVPQSMKGNEMNDTEGVCARQSGGEIRFK